MSVDYVKANDNIVQDTKDLMLWQFNDSENIQKILEIVAEEYGSYEEAAERIFTSFLLTEAEGFALDSIGEFLNFPRQGQTDSEYRTALIFSAIGANSTIARDDIANLLNVVTGGVGGYIYRGRYHDLYIYLQLSCIDKEVATEFLDKYLPINTNASILFESGLSFGFLNNEAAGGFDRVRALPAEGAIAIQFPYADLATPSGVIIPNGNTFEDPANNIYRTDGEVDLEDTMIGLRWLINGYVTGDSLEFLDRNNETGETISETFTFQSIVPEELAYEVTKVLVENDTLVQRDIYLTEETDDVLYVGYEEISDPSLFSSRSTSAVEYNQFTEQAAIVSADTVRNNYDETGAVSGVLYETYSKNLLPHGNYPDDVTGDWTVTGTIAAQSTDNTLEYVNTISSVTYDINVGDSVSVSKSVSTERDGFHSFSLFLRPEVLTYTLRSRANEFVFQWDGTQVVEVSSDFNIFGYSIVTIEGQGCLRVYVTDTYNASESVDLEISAIADQGSAGTLQITCAQFEPWIRPTSYIPTQGSSEERATDIFALPTEPTFVGASDNHTFIISDVQGDLQVLSAGFLVSSYKEERVIDEGTLFTPVDSYDFTINSVVALDEWSSGFGDEQSLDTDGSSSESGRLCTRASLTSRDVLGLPEVAVVDDVFEYELDSRFSEVISFVSSEESYARPIVPLTLYREFRGPAWDGTLIDPGNPDKIYSTGVALRSPEATTQVASPETSVINTLAKVNSGDPLSYTNNVGDIEIPERSFYFEFDLTKVAASDAIYELYASADFAKSTEETQASTTTTTETVLRIAVVSEYREGTTDYEVSAQVIVLNNVSEVNSVTGVSSEENYQVIGKPYSQVYSDPNLAQPINIGFLVDPVQNIIRCYVDGATYDGNGGIVEITSLGANHTDGTVVVGDVLDVPVAWDNNLLFQIGGSTDASKAEPMSIDDYGSIRFNYTKARLQYLDQLPQNTMDIFGRILTGE